MSRIQKFSAGLGAVLLLGVLQTAFAQSDIKIGYVNVPFLIQNAPQTQALNQRLQNEFAPREAELQASQEDLQEMLQTYQRDASVMGEAERAAMERELEQGDRDLQRRQAVLQEDFQIRQNELLGELQQTIGREVQAYVEQEEFDLILSEVVYFSESVDITQDVLQFVTANYSVD